jgi:hypothetical protein
MSFLKSHHFSSLKKRNLSDPAGGPNPNNKNNNRINQPYCDENLLEIRPNENGINNIDQIVKHDSGNGKHNSNNAHEPNYAIEHLDQIVAEDDAVFSNICFFKRKNLKPTLSASPTGRSSSSKKKPNTQKSHHESPASARRSMYTRNTSTKTIKLDFLSIKSTSFKSLFSSDAFCNDNKLRNKQKHDEQFKNRTYLFSDLKNNDI